MALTEPTPVAVDGKCNVGVHREDETGTIWLLDCALDRPGEHLAIRGLGYSAHFRYVVNDDNERTDIKFEAVVVRTRQCQWFIPDFAPFTVPIDNEKVMIQGTAAGQQPCDQMLVTYDIDWDMSNRDIVFDGVLEPVA